MGSGIAKQIRERWPELYERYIHFCDYHNQYGEGMLGKILIYDIGNRKHVVNMFAQDFYGYDGRRFTSYDAFAQCLNSIKHYLNNRTVGFPKNIGCGLGGGNWKVISALIEEILGEDYEVYIYELET
jgi:O-acetyl-ADP-ribose deacetylase (regulator of RNase III)